MEYVSLVKSILKEQVIEEEAIMKTDGLSLFIKTYDEYSGMIGFYKIDEDNIIILSGAQYDTNDEDVVQIERIAAEKNYGPMTYVTLMQLSGEKGVCSDDTEVSKSAANVWEKFYNNGEGNDFAYPVKKLQRNDYREHINYAYKNKVTLDLEKANDLKNKNLRSKIEQNINSFLSTNVTIDNQYPD